MYSFPSVSSVLNTDSIFSYAPGALQARFEIPASELVLENYSCALKQKNSMLLQGRLYVFPRHVGFACDLLGQVKSISIKICDIISIKKAKTVMVVPNAIEIRTMESTFVFASFLFRNEAFRMLQNLWNISKGIAAFEGRLASTIARSPTFAVDDAEGGELEDNQSDQRKSVDDDFSRRPVGPEDVDGTSATTVIASGEASSHRIEDLDALARRNIARGHPAYFSSSLSSPTSPTHAATSSERQNPSRQHSWPVTPAATAGSGIAGFGAVGRPWFPRWGAVAAAAAAVLWGVCMHSAYRDYSDLRDIDNQVRALILDHGLLGPAGAHQLCARGGGTAPPTCARSPSDGGGREGGDWPGLAGGGGKGGGGGWWAARTEAAIVAAETAALLHEQTAARQGVAAPPPPPPRAVASPPEGEPPGALGAQPEGSPAAAAAAAVIENRMEEAEALLAELRRVVDDIRRGHDPEGRDIRRGHDPEGRDVERGHGEAPRDPQTAGEGGGGCGMHGCRDGDDAGGVPDGAAAAASEGPGGPGVRTAEGREGKGERDSGRGSGEAQPDAVVTIGDEGLGPGAPAGGGGDEEATRAAAAAREASPSGAAAAAAAAAAAGQWSLW